MNDGTRETRDWDGWTPDEIEAIIPAAIEAHDFEAVVALVKLLAVKDAHRAELMLETINVGIALNRAES